MTTAATSPTIHAPEATIAAMPEFKLMAEALERVCVTAALCTNPQRGDSLNVKLGNATALSVAFHKAVQSRVKAGELTLPEHFAAEVATSLQHVYCFEIGRCFNNPDRFFRVPSDTLLSQYGVNLALKYHEENCLGKKVVLENLVQQYNLHMKQRIASLAVTTPEARTYARHLLTLATGTPL